MGVKLLDGGSGTFLWALAEADGVEKVPVWRYNIEHPEYVEKIAKSYIDAGSNVIYTNTFTANRLDVQRQSSYKVEDVVTAAVNIAKKAANGTDVKVALSMGPLSEMMEPYGDLEEDEVAEIYDEIIKPGVAAGADIILFETFMDVEMLRVCVETAKPYGKPIFTTMAFEAMGKTMFGVSPEKMIETLEPLGVAALGMNCGIAPDEALPIIKVFKENTNLPIIFKPNAGKPILNADGTTKSTYDENVFAEDAAPALEFVSYLGGCCGTSPAYIAKLKEGI